jgi:hypothetical protein
MQLTPQQHLLQFAHILQRELIPVMEECLGPLSPQLRLLSSVCALLPLERFLGSFRARTGRPAKDRHAICIAFLAKSIYNLPTTRDLLDRLKSDPVLRRFCGWESAQAVPHESKFSRCFAQFAALELPQKLHAAILETTQRGRLVCHIARDSSAIPARERLAAPPARTRTQHRRNKNKAKPQRVRRGHFPRAKASERGTRLERQRHQTLAQMLAAIPGECGLGVKTASDGNQRYWRGYKLHLDVADGQIPIAAILTSASVHDSQVAIPLMSITTSRVGYLYDLMDSAYDAKAILEHSRQAGRVPIVTPHPRRGTKRKSPLTKIFPEKPTPELSPAAKERMKERTMVERVYSRLKDEFGGNLIRVRGASKVMAHLMFGIVALTVDQWLLWGEIQV